MTDEGMLPLTEKEGKGAEVETERKKTEIGKGAEVGIVLGGTVIVTETVTDTGIGTVIEKGTETGSEIEIVNEIGTGIVVTETEIGAGTEAGRNEGKDARVGPGLSRKRGGGVERGKEVSVKVL